MTLLWISLPHTWSLQTVQAGVNFIINLLCIGGTFVLVRLFWLRAARKVLRGKDVLTYKLLSLNTVGETIDAMRLLRMDLFEHCYRGLLIQCIIVITLALVGISAAFIARFATRLGTNIVKQNVSGVLAQRSRHAMEWAPVELNATYETLKRVNFPPNRLLEFWPSSDDWQFVAEQWNSSWSMDCQHIRLTEIPNPVATGNCTSPTSTEYPAFPQLYDPVRDWFKLDHAAFTSSSYSWNPGKFNTTYNWLITLHGYSLLDYNKSQRFATQMELRTRTFYLNKVPAPPSDTCLSVGGPIGSAYFTGTTCTLKRDLGQRSMADLKRWGAYPDASDISKETRVLGSHFGNRWALDLTAGHEPPIFEGEEMVMYYQAYQITKDTNAGRLTNLSNIFNETLDIIFINGTKTLDVKVSVPQVSILCLVICSIGGVVVIAGLFDYFYFTTANRRRLEGVPESKLQWMLKTLQQELSIRNPAVRNRVRYSMLDDAQHEGTLLIDVDRIGRNDIKGVESTVAAVASP